MNKTTVIFVRYLGVIFSSVIAFLSIKVFLDFEPQDAATLFAIIGWLLFVPIMQFGYGKPSYALVRQKRQNLEDVSLLVRKLTNLFSLQGVAVCCVMGFITYLLAITQNYSGNKIELMIFALGLSSIGACTLMRDLAYALDLETYYELLETLRRLICVVIYVGIYVDISFSIVGGFGILVGIGSFFVMRNIILKSVKSGNTRTSSHSSKHISGYRFRIKTLYYWGFTFSELAFYNIPLLIFTIWPSSNGMAYYGIWSKFFIFLVLPFRIFIDTQMNQIVSSFFGKHNHLSKKYLGICVIVSLTMLVFCVAILSVFGASIYQFLGAGEIIDTYFLASLALWGFVNVIQHTFGSFVLSYGNGFQFSLIVSLLGLATIGSTFIIFYDIYSNVGMSLFAAGIAYAVIAVCYLLKALLVLKSNTDISA